MAFRAEGAIVVCGGLLITPLFRYMNTFIEQDGGHGRMSVAHSYEQSRSYWLVATVVNVGTMLYIQLHQTEVKTVSYIK